MGYCWRCGKNMDEEGLCASCTMPAPAYTAPTYTVHDIMADDFPCQRCGMYLPKTELQMWNSRLYCNYCIMDLKDEEQRMTRPAETPIPAAGREGLREYGGREPCERCGRQVDTLYSARGKRLCATCLSDEGGKPPAGADTFSQAIKVIWDFGEKAGIVKKEPEKAGAKNSDEGGRGERVRMRNPSFAGKNITAEGGGKGSRDAGGDRGTGGDYGKTDDIKSSGGWIFDVKGRKFVPKGKK